MHFEQESQNHVTKIINLNNTKQKSKRKSKVVKEEWNYLMSFNVGAKNNGMLSKCKK